MNEFKIAFEQLLRFKLPEKTGAAGKPINYQQIIYFLPVIGLIVGLTLYLAATILYSIIPNAGVAAIICAIALPILQWWLYKGDNFTAVNAALANWQSPSAGDTGYDSPERRQWTFTILNILILLKLLAIGLLVYFGFTPWLIIVPLLAATTFAETLAQDESKANHTEGENLNIPAHWCLAGVVTLLVAGLLDKLIAGLFVLVIAWLAAPYIEKKIREKSTVNDDTVYRVIMEMMEIIILWIGVLAIQ